mmetsp:Transcript_40782/g.46336  ORF Transcript_40782/g.46336 Transcript_40782/m.46336 type:complete len:211 (+) Transcript_40782:100-732(+)
MKFFLGLSTLLCVNAFVVQQQQQQQLSSSSLNSIVNRRESLERVAAIGVGLVVTGAPSVASAAGRGSTYEPIFKDLQLIYQLGLSLDNLVKKFSEEATIEAGLDGVRSFNKSPSFYSGYAKNFISKSVTNNADGDPRIGYIRSASTLIGSTETLLQGGAVLVEKDARQEAVRRITKAQAFIGKFLAESGVENNEDIKAFVKKHPFVEDKK